MIRLRVKRALTPLGRIASEKRERDCAQRLCRLRDEAFSKTPIPSSLCSSAIKPLFPPRTFALGKGDKESSAQTPQSTHFKYLRTFVVDFLCFFKNAPHHFPLIAFAPRSRAPRYPLLRSLCFVVIAFVNPSLACERFILSKSVCGGTGGRDALRKRHSAAFLAKARERLCLERSQPPPSRGPREIRDFLECIVATF